MRRLWPLYYDDFSLRLWAAAVSVSINLIIALLVYLRVAFENILWTSVPAIFTYALVTRQGSEEAGLNWPGLIAALAANLLFYYFIAWLAIGSFRPAKPWWPEKRS
jgi:hypothetical protein